jgi:hypothetical protein
MVPERTDWQNRKQVTRFLTLPGFEKGGSYNVRIWYQAGLLTVL